MFHPTYSAGTAAILGSAELEYPLHHYWEVEILSPMYGTDVMVGLASSQADTASHSHSFESLLGLDTESWGFSYQGFTQHNGIKVGYESLTSQNHCFWDLIGIIKVRFPKLAKFVDLAR